MVCPAFPAMRYTMAIRLLSIPAIRAICSAVSGVVASS